MLDLENPVERLFRVVNSEEVRSTIPGDENTRLRELAKCRWITQGERVAIFREKWAGDHEAVSFDIDAPSDFTWAVLDHMFGPVGARALYLFSGSDEAGHVFRAVYRGMTIDGIAAWRLDRDEFAQAQRPDHHGQRKLRLAR